MQWQPRRAFLAGMLLALTLSAGCSRQATLPATVGNAGSPQTLPFQRAARARGFSPTASLLPAGIPAGTVLAVRIRSVISSATSQAGDSFEAVLDAPIMIQGEILAPSGAAVTGKIMTAKPSGGTGDPGYLRLTLTAISIHGKMLLLQTSSLFTKASAYAGQATPALGTVSQTSGSAPAEDKKDVEYPAGHRLSFRLTEALPLQAEVATLPSE